MTYEEASKELKDKGGVMFFSLTKGFFLVSNLYFEVLSAHSNNDYVYITENKI